MATLTVEWSTPDRSTEPTVAEIVSYAVMDDPRRITDVEGDAQLYVGVPVLDGASIISFDYSEKVPYQDIQVRGEASVVPIVKSNANPTTVATIVSYTVIEHEQVPVMDNSVSFADSSEGAKPISEISLNMGVTYDSMFNFNIGAQDGIRAVTDNNGRVVVSGPYNYDVGDMRLGKTSTRTVITNTNFKLTLVLTPTIVKQAL